MAETFSYCTRVGATGDISQRTWENEFGDGYTQAGGIGINTKSQSWDISVTGQMREGDDLKGVRDFLDRHEGYKSFIWSAPGAGAGRYRATGYKLNAAGAGMFTLSVTFKQVYNP
jgi:phage-related protein